MIKIPEKVPKVVIDIGEVYDNINTVFKDTKADFLSLDDRISIAVSRRRYSITASYPGMLLTVLMARTVVEDDDRNTVPRFSVTLSAGGSWGSLTPLWSDTKDSVSESLLKEKLKRHEDVYDKFIELLSELERMTVDTVDIV